MVKQRRARNRILQLQTPNGDTTKDQLEIENILVQHFKQSYEDSITAGFDHILKEISALPIPQLPAHQLYLFNRLITNEEIEATVFQLGPNKAPGLDGILAFFYQEY